MEKRRRRGEQPLKCVVCTTTALDQRLSVVPHSDGSLLVNGTVRHMRNTPSAATDPMGLCEMLYVWYRFQIFCGSSACVTLSSDIRHVQLGSLVICEG
mmetsp:Transcript_58679/g.108231  ORF Transcript_58679/g.108231 Transcript_58679/m.108231 type:complete len:98 (-) Transcript_58679:741-1034(-)